MKKSTAPNKIVSTKIDDRDSGTESDNGEANLKQDLSTCDISTNSHFVHHCQGLSTMDVTDTENRFVSSSSVWLHLVSDGSLSVTAFTPLLYSNNNNNNVNRVAEKKLYACDVDCCTLLEKVTLTSEQAATGNGLSSDGEAKIPSEGDWSISELGMNFASADDDEVSSLFEADEQNEADSRELVPDFTSQPPPRCLRGTSQTVSPGCFFAQSQQRNFWVSLMADTANYTPRIATSTGGCLDANTSADLAKVPRPSLNFEKMQKRLLRRSARCAPASSSVFSKRLTPPRCRGRLLGSSGQRWDDC